jgi:hypothetical protein
MYDVLWYDVIVVVWRLEEEEEVEEYCGNNSKMFSYIRIHEHTKKWNGIESEAHAF